MGSVHRARSAAELFVCDTNTVQDLLDFLLSLDEPSVEPLDLGHYLLDLGYVEADLMEQLLRLLSTALLLSLLGLQSPAP